MKDVILSISDSDKHFSTAIKEYEKRLWKDLFIQNIKPTKYWSKKQIIEKDTKNIVELLEKKYKSYQKLLLSKEWRQLDTISLKNKIWWKNNVFIIGWPYWFDEILLSELVDAKISFGKVTLPHWLAKLVISEQIYRISKLVISEQIYRISMIENGRNYHY